MIWPRIPSIQVQRTQAQIQLVRTWIGAQKPDVNYHWSDPFAQLHKTKSAKFMQRSCIMRSLARSTNIFTYKHVRVSSLGPAMQHVFKQQRKEKVGLVRVTQSAILSNAPPSRNCIIQLNQKALSRFSNESIQYQGHSTFDRIHWSNLSALRVVFRNLKCLSFSRVSSNSQVISTCVNIAQVTSRNKVYVVSDGLQHHIPHDEWWCRTRPLPSNLPSVAPVRTANPWQQTSNW